MTEQSATVARKNLPLKAAYLAKVVSTSTPKFTVSWQYKTCKVTAIEPVLVAGTLKQIVTVFIAVLQQVYSVGFINIKSARGWTSKLSCRSHVLSSFVSDQSSDQS